MNFFLDVCMCGIVSQCNFAKKITKNNKSFRNEKKNNKKKNNIN